MKKIDNYKVNAIPSDKQNIKISVCVAVYNSQDYLKKSIDSIINQTYKNLEIILVDDGSTDNCGSICDEYALFDNRVKVIHKENGGLYTSRNEGIEAATGDYICFLDGDDYIDPEMYEYMLAVILQEDADLAVCRYRQIFVDGIKDDSTDSVIIYEKNEILEQYLKEDEKILIQNAAWNKLYKRSLIENLRFPARWYEDMLYTPQLLALPQKSVYIDKAFHNYICDRSTSIMNKGISSHIFTDLIPNLYDRSKFLNSIGCHDVALISDYFMYKKIMQYILLVYRSDDPQKEEHLEYLDEKIRNGIQSFNDIFNHPYANINEYKKIKMYLKNKKMYFAFMDLNEKVIIPIKRKILNIRR